MMVVVIMVVTPVVSTLDVIGYVATQLGSVFDASAALTLPGIDALASFALTNFGPIGALTLSIRSRFTAPVRPVAPDLLATASVLRSTDAASETSASKISAGLPIAAATKFATSGSTFETRMSTRSAAGTLEPPGLGKIVSDH
jgi:hypothetical protein